ncbi:isoprenoid synthase domain-containing protein [Scheffersomyces xylosifermentans]|uniref:isoprenoid synthase domain-containing protein n=1 Tax=Scheffersomyces xylosifermentans TaxID=1304137 RepID=UPI00315C8623
MLRAGYGGVKAVPKRITLARCYSVSGSDRYALQLHNAQENVNTLLETHDRSSYVLAQYIPEPARNAFLAIRAFNLEVNKINDGGSNYGSVASQASSQLSKSMGISTADMKFKFWSDLMARVFTDDPHSEKDIGEPVAILLRDALRNDLNLDISYFHQFLQTRRHFLKNKTFNTIDDICAYGEGTYSQLNYQTQGLLLSPSISPSVISLLEHSTSLQSRISDIAAHIGQATAISAMILGLNYYATSRNQVTLPVNVMSKFDLSQEAVLRLTQGHIRDENEIKDIREKLKNVIYETATTSNDHMLTAREKLNQSRQEIIEIVKSNKQDKLLSQNSKKWRKWLPDVIFTPFMVSIPTTLYLQKLEKSDFDIFHPKMQQKEWRLAWRSFKDYHQRTI